MPSIKEVSVPSNDMTELDVPAAGDQQVILFCQAKPGMTIDDSNTLEVVRAGEGMTIMRSGQFRRMTRDQANWHVFKCRRNDESNPLTLVSMELTELDAMKSKLRESQAAQANYDAQVAKEAATAAVAAEAAAVAAEKAAAEAAAVRLDLVKKAVDAGAIADEGAAEGMTNDDLVQAAKDSKNKK